LVQNKKEDIVEKGTVHPQMEESSLVTNDEADKPENLLTTILNA